MRSESATGRRLRTSRPAKTRSTTRRSSRVASSSGTYTGPGTRDCTSRSRPSRESVGKTIEIPESRTAVLSGPSRSPVQRSRAGLRGGRNRAVSTESGARAVITIHASCVSSSVK